MPEKRESQIPTLRVIYPHRLQATQKRALGYMVLSDRTGMLASDTLAVCLSHEVYKKALEVAVKGLKSVAGCTANLPPMPTSTATPPEDPPGNCHYWMGKTFRRDGGSETLEEKCFGCRAEDALAKIREIKGEPEEGFGQ